MVLVWWPSMVFTQIAISIVLTEKTIVAWLVIESHTPVTLPQVVTLLMLLAILQKTRLIYMHIT